MICNHTGRTGAIIMPITITSERDGRVAVWTYPATFTVADIVAVSETFQRTVLDQAAQKVYVISDFSAVQELPKNILSAAIRLAKAPHPMMGSMIEVTPNGFVNALAQAFSRLTPGGMVSVRRSLPDAFEEVDRWLAREAQQQSRRG